LSEARSEIVPQLAVKKAEEEARPQELSTQPQ
jgi:hypothetical protein